MNVPKMNWKQFISTGVLEHKKDNPKQKKQALMNNVIVTLSKSREKNTLPNTSELDRILSQNEILLNALHDKHHPFHLMAYEFLNTQLYDSRQLFQSLHRQIKQILKFLQQKKSQTKNKQKERTKESSTLLSMMLTKKKIKKLSCQINKFERYRILKK